MDTKKRIFGIVSAEELLSRLSLREMLTLCTEVMTDDELRALMENPEIIYKPYMPRTKTEASAPKKPADEPEQKVAEALTQTEKLLKRMKDGEKHLNCEFSSLTIPKKTTEEIKVFQEEPKKEETTPARDYTNTIQVEKLKEYQHNRKKVNDEKIKKAILSERFAFSIPEISERSGFSYATIKNMVTEMLSNGELENAERPESKKGKFYRVKKVAEETKPAEPVIEVPKTIYARKKEAEKKGPKDITCNDLYQMPKVIECIYRELYTRMRKCMDNMGQYDIKELLEKNFPELRLNYNLGTNNALLMHAGKSLMDYLTSVNIGGKPRRYDCTVVMRENDTYKARPSEMKRYAKAKGWN